MINAASLGLVVKVKRAAQLVSGPFEIKEVGRLDTSVALVPLRGYRPKVCR